MNSIIKVYLDICCFNRPYDDQSQNSIHLETEAKLMVQEKIKVGKINLCWSYILDFENNANPFIEKQIEIQKWKKIATSFVDESSQIISTMENLTFIGLKPLDALHLSCAISLECQYFLTVDKGILNKSNKIKNIIVLNPVNFIIQKEY